MTELVLAILGGGPAGYTAALRAAQLGAEVILVERDKLGGTCLHRGCIPTKALLRSALFFWEAQRAEELGIRCKAVELLLDKISARKREVIGRLQSALEALVAGRRIKVLYGQAELLAPHRVLVRKKEGGSESFVADRVIIATGSAPLMGPFSSALPGVISSDEALDLEDLPSRLVVVGGGVVGIELATLYACLGSKVVVLEQLPTVLQGAVDGELIRYLLSSSKLLGIEIVTECKVLELEEREGRVNVRVNRAGEIREYVGEKILVSIGRQPVLQGVRPERLGIEREGLFVKVDGSLRTSLEGVFAAGDVIGRPLLAHAAYAEGEVAAEAALGRDGQIDYRVMPVCVFSYPELASVGLTEQEARTRGHEVKVSKALFRGNGRALAIGEAVGMVKLVADAQSGELLGGHIAGPLASELIHEVALALAARIKVREVAEMVHAHPTLAETINEASRALFR